jgi:hypothetical protein
MHAVSIPLGHPARGTVVNGPEIAQVLAEAESNGKVIVSSSTAIQLRSTDPRVFIVTGSSSQTIRLPIEYTLQKGEQFFFINKGSASMTIRASGSSGTVLAIAAATLATGPTIVIATLQDPTTVGLATAWAAYYSALSFALGKSFTVNQTMTLTSLTSGLTFTLPSVTCTIASPDFDNVFGADQTFSFRIIGASTVRNGSSTVALLPNGANGDKYDVTDANGPTFGAAVVGGGAVRIPVYYDSSGGVSQVETATVVGTVTGSGNATVVITALAMTGTPKTISVAVTNGDSASTVGGKIRTALGLDADVIALFAISGAGANVVLTKYASANDATLNISIDNGTCTGLTSAPTSTNTTAGVTPWKVG